MKREARRRFGYHKLSKNALEDVTQLRAAFATLGEQIVEASAPSREQSLALTKLEEAAFWTNKAISNRGDSEFEAPGSP